MKHSKVIILLLLAALNLKGQDTHTLEVDLQVRELNELEFTKYSSKQEYENSGFGSSSAYVHEGVVRKTTVYNEYDEVAGYFLTCYYNEKGEIIMLDFSDGEGKNHVGKVYFKDKEIYQSEFYQIYHSYSGRPVDYIKLTGDRKKDMEDRLKPESKKYSKIMFSKISSLDGFAAVDPIKLYHSVITGSHVVGRRKDNSNSDAVTKFYPFQKVHVIEKGKKENIAPYGEHHWYKVSKNEKEQVWVFGHFLQAAGHRFFMDY